MTSVPAGTDRTARVLEVWPCGCRVEEPQDRTRYADRLVICPKHAGGQIARPKWREIVLLDASPVSVSAAEGDA